MAVPTTWEKILFHKIFLQCKGRKVAWKNFLTVGYVLMMVNDIPLTKHINRHGGRNDVNRRVFPNWSTILASRATTMESVTDRKWAGPTSPRLYTMARESCWVSSTNCANCHGNMKAREERERSKICNLPGWRFLRVHTNIHTVMYEIPSLSMETVHEHVLAHAHAHVHVHIYI